MTSREPQKTALDVLRELDRMASPVWISTAAEIDAVLILELAGHVTTDMAPLGASALNKEAPARVRVLTITRLGRHMPGSCPVHSGATRLATRGKKVWPREIAESKNVLQTKQNAPVTNLDKNLALGKTKLASCLRRCAAVIALAASVVTPVHALNMNEGAVAGLASVSSCTASASVSTTSDANPQS